MAISTLRNLGPLGSNTPYDNHTEKANNSIVGIGSIGLINHVMDPTTQK